MNSKFYYKSELNRQREIQTREESTSRGEGETTECMYSTTGETERAERHLFNTTSGGFYSDVSLSPHAGLQEKIHAESLSTHTSDTHTHTL